MRATLLLALAGVPASGAFAHAPLAQHGSVRSGQSYLGVDVRDLSEEQMGAQHLRDYRGAEILRVDHDGPAGKMGLREHDVVVQMNGIPLEGEEQLRRMLHDSPPGRSVTFLISREGQQLTVTGIMADRGEVERRAWQQHLVPVPQTPVIAIVTEEAADDPAETAPVPHYGKSFLGTLLMSPSYTGAMLEKMGPQLAQFFGAPSGVGLLVRSIEGNSPAQRSGMHAGDIVVRANLHDIKSMGDWAKQIKDAKGKPVTVVVVRDRQEKTLTLVPDGKRRSSLEPPNLELPGLELQLEPVGTLELCLLAFEP